MHFSVPGLTLCRHIVGEWVDVIPTVGFVWRKLGALPGSHRSWEVFDFGGTQQFRPLIRHMYHGGQTDAIVYVVSATPNLTPADAIELKAVCRTSALRQVPLLIVLNKCDLPGAIGAEEALRLMGVTMAELSASGRKVDFVTASAKTGVGLDRIMQWLASLE